MMAVVGAIGLAATAIGTLAVSVFAGLLLLNAMLRVLEAAVPTARTADNVADFAEFARQATGRRPSSKLERAA